MTGVVAIGCSLGGFRALGRLLGALPSSFTTPIAVVQHRASHGTEEYCAALQRSCTLRVCEAEDKQPLTPGTVHVAPAGYHMLLDEGAIALSVDQPVNFARPSIDVLFESAADAFGPGAVVVVLSGASADGTRGARAVLAKGGRVVVQDPSDAECRVMPATMLADSPAAAVMPLDGIAGWLERNAQAAAASG